LYYKIISTFKQTIEQFFDVVVETLNDLDDLYGQLRH